MPEQESLHEGEPGVICATLGHNIGRVLVAIHMHELDDALILVLPSSVIVHYVQPSLNFYRRHNSRIDNRKFIAKHK